MTFRYALGLLSLSLLGGSSCAAKRPACAAAKANPYATVTGKQRRPRDGSCRVCPPVPAPPACAPVELTELSAQSLDGKVDQVVSVKGYPRVLDGCTEVGCGCACCNDCDGVLALSTSPPATNQVGGLHEALVVLDNSLCHGDDDSSCCSVPGKGPFVATGTLVRPGTEAHPYFGRNAFVLLEPSLCTP